MHNNLHDVIPDVLACLDEIAGGQLLPEQANARLSSVRRRHPDAAIDLVWEDQAFDGAFHYDALVRPAAAGKTISLSVCPDDALPWALRGLQRWRDSELLRVNEVTMAVEQAIAQLDLLWEKTALMQRLIDSCIVEGELQRRDIQISTADIQAAFDGMRRRRGLYTAAAMQAWLDNSGVSRAALEDTASKLARTAKLRDVIAGPQVNDYFDAHRAQFDEIKLAVLEVRSETDAERVAQSIRAGGVTLVDAAQTLFLEDMSGRTRLSFQQDARHTLATEFAGVEPAMGTVHVCARDNTFLVVQVLAIHAAQLSPLTTQRVKAKLFQDWLTEQRRAARIEWFWGEAQRTAKERAN
ncbi:MAG TPA: TIGR04500 family putative peptide maturation system protein [Povalibacter sp.]